MSRVKIYIIIFLTAFFCLSMPLRAEWAGNLSIENGYDENAFRSDISKPTYVNRNSLAIGYFPKNDPWAASYNLGLTHFGSYPDRLYSNHNLAFSYDFYFHKDGDAKKEVNSVLGLFSSMSGRIDKEALEFYDYYQGAVSASLEHYIGEAGSVEAGYKFRYRTYPNFNDMTYFENYLSAGYQTSFPTNTSLFLGADMGLKNYISLSQFDTQPVDTDMTAASGSSVEVRPGHGGDNGKQMKQRQSMGGTGSDIIYTPGIVYKDPFSGRLTLNANIGQSLGKKTGLSLYLGKSFIMSRDGTSLVSGTADYYGEDELFDDPYSYESSDVSLKLTKILFDKYTVKLTGFYSYKHYLYEIDLLTDDTDVTGSADDRRDDYSGILANVSRSFDTSILVFNGIELTLSYYYINNNSNSPFFNYYGNSVNFSVEAGF